MLFENESIETWRKRIAAGPRSRKHLEFAKTICSELLDPTSEYYFDFREREKELWRSREGNFCIPCYVPTLALTGLAADDDTLRDAARDALMVIVDQRLAIDGLGEYTGWSGGQWPFHDAGKYYKMLGVTYDLVKDILDEDQKKRVYAHVEELYPIIKKDRPLRQAYMENNQGARYMLGILCMELAFHKDMQMPFLHTLERPGHWIQKAVRLNVGKDGAPFEGHSYGTMSNLFYAVVADILARSGGEDITRDVRFHGNGDYCLYDLIYSHGYATPFSDSDLMMMGQLVYFSAIRYRDAAHLWLWDQFNSDDSHPYSTLRGMREQPNMYSVPWLLLWPDDDAVEPKAPDTTHPKWKHFRDRGLVVGRSGFDAQSLHVSMFSGTNPQHWHSQADQNQVNINGLGRRWIIDPGYHYTNENGERKLARYSEAHNNIHIDGIGQASKDSPDAYPRGCIDSVAVKGNELIAVADATEAYATSTRVSKAQRILRVNLEGGNLSWVDEYETDDGKEHDYELTLMAEDDLSFEEAGDNTFILRDGEKQMTIHFKGSAPLSYRKGNFAEFPTLHIAQRGMTARFEVSFELTA